MSILTMSHLFFFLTHFGHVGQSLGPPWEPSWAELGCDERIEGPVSEIGCSEDDRCMTESCHEDAMLLQYALRMLENRDAKKPPHLVCTPLGVPKSYLKKLDQLVAESGVQQKLKWQRSGGSCL